MPLVKSYMLLYLFSIISAHIASSFKKKKKTTHSIIYK